MHTRETGVPGDSISGRRRYISSPGTLFVADTSSWGNASFLRSSESQEFDVVILLSWPRDPSRGCGRIGVAGCWWRVLRRPPTLSQVHIPDSRILWKKPLSPRIRCTFILPRRYSTIFPIFTSRGVSKAPWLFNFVATSCCSCPLYAFHCISISYSILFLEYWHWDIDRII